jgi:hypothetical protein
LRHRSVASLGQHGGSPHGQSSGPEVKPVRLRLMHVQGTFSCLSTPRHTTCIRQFMNAKLLTIQKKQGVQVTGLTVARQQRGFGGRSTSLAERRAFRTADDGRLSNVPRIGRGGGELIWLRGIEFSTCNRFAGGRRRFVVSGRPWRSCGAPDYRPTCLPSYNNSFSVRRRVPGAWPPMPSAEEPAPAAKRFQCVL